MGSMAGQIEAFAAARRFLADPAANGKGQFARNVRTADVVAVTGSLTGAIGVGEQTAQYSGAGAYPGPLDQSGNMPASSAGLIIASAVVLPMQWAIGDALDQAAIFASLSQSTHHVVSVAGTNVVAKHGAFNVVYPSLGLAVSHDGATTTYGTPDGSVQHEREPEPLLWVGPGERVTQALYLRRALSLGVSVTVELVLQLVVADKGTD